jgi:TolB-like protein
MKIIKKSILLSILILLLNPIYSASIFDPPYKKLSDSIIKTVKENNKNIIAVLAFHSLDEEDTKEGELISEEIIYELIKNGSIHVIERQQIENLMDELQFNQTGAIDAATAKKIGNGLGADILVIGNFTIINEREIKVYSKVVDTETFKVLGAQQEVVKRIKLDKGAAEKKAARREAMWSKFEMGLGSGIMIPSGAISGTYTISASDLSGTEKITHTFNNIQTEASMPLVLRTNFWLNKVFGLAADIGYNSFRFSPQTFSATSTKTSEDILGFTNSETTITRDFIMTEDEYFQVNNVYLGLNLLIRIPIDPKFFPFVGIGYKFAFQAIEHKGSGSDLFAPITDRELGIEFGYTPGEGSLQTLLSLFTYMIGVEWFITETLGLMVEYQLINYGEAIYIIPGLTSFTHTDDDLGTISGTSSTLEMTIDPITAHNIHVAIMFKF